MEKAGSTKLRPNAQPDRIEVAVDIGIDEQGLEPELEGWLQDDGEAVAELVFPSHSGKKAVADVVKIVVFGFFAVGRAGIAGIEYGFILVGKVVGQGQADGEEEVVLVIQFLEEQQFCRRFEEPVLVDDALFGGAGWRGVVRGQGCSNRLVSGVGEPQAGLEARPAAPPLGK